MIFTRNKGLKSKTKYRSIWADIIGVLVTVIVFILPFYFLVVNAAKSQEEWKKHMQRKQNLYAARPYYSRYAGGSRRKSKGKAKKTVKRRKA